MSRHHHASKAFSRMGLLLLAVALLFAQGLQLHAHALGHDDLPRHADSLDAADVAHLHQSGLHLSLDDSHLDHHQGAMSEVDASPEGIFKSFTGKLPLLLALLVVLFAFSPPALLATSDRHREATPELVWRYLFGPPLRAPPR